MNSTDLGLGKLITTEQQRDAIHVAVAPVVAAEVLYPGQHVGFLPGGQVGGAGEHIGIVDPYLKEFVNKGGSFWLFLYPQTVTGMRHEWSHPAFSGLDRLPTPEQVQSAVGNDKSESEKWLRAYAILMNTYDKDPDDAFNRLIDGLKSREIFAHGTDLHGLFDLDDSEDVRFHAERYLGTKIDWDNFQFSCSC